MIPLALHTHFKGGLYRVVTVAKHSETDEQLVIYKSLETGVDFARPLSMWSEEVDWPDGTRGPRFKLAGD